MTTDQLSQEILALFPGALIKPTQVTEPGSVSLSVTVDGKFAGVASYVFQDEGCYVWAGMDFSIGRGSTLSEAVQLKAPAKAVIADWLVRSLFN